MCAVLARLAWRRWPAPDFRRPCSLRGLVAYPPHSVWLHGHHAPEQRQLGTQEPDADCQVQCRSTLVPTRARIRALPALHLQQHQRVSPSVERHSDSACGRRPCMAPRPESPKKGAQRRKTNAVVKRKRDNHMPAPWPSYRHRCPPPALSDEHQQHAFHPATSQGGERSPGRLKSMVWAVVLLRCKRRTHRLSVMASPRLDFGKP